MKTIVAAPWLTEMTETLENMYRHGWDERNGGNVSMLLEKAQLEDYIDFRVLRTFPLNVDATPLIGRYFLVTGSGKYFKNALKDPEGNLCVFRVADDGKTGELLWGLPDGGLPTSELYAHLMSHMERLKVDPEHHIVMHCHPANLLAMTYVHPLDEKAFTHTLWEMCTECICVFPDGVNVLPWMLCGTYEIGLATADKMKTARLVIWSQHGIYGAGKDLDETFGLIETAEKAAEIYMKIAHLPKLNTLTDEDMKQLADFFSKTVREGYLNL